jgi:hypothetical protein
MAKHNAKHFKPELRIRGSIAVEALRSKPEGRGFDNR